MLPCCIGLIHKSNRLTIRNVCHKVKLTEVFHVKLLLPVEKKTNLQTELMIGTAALATQGIDMSKSQKNCHSLLISSNFVD